MRNHKENNFDLLRLFAAIQVVFQHGISKLNISDSVLSSFYDNYLNYFKGVPIFFTISGFLIMWSVERNGINADYFKNRVFRIFPALWFCLLITIGLLIFRGLLPFETLTTPSFWGWFAMQISFLQFVVPQFLHDLGIHNPNGSLWTITVELQYYIAIPILYYIFKKLKDKWIYAALLLFIGSFALNYSLQFNSYSEIEEKLIKASVLPYLFNFLIGIMIFKLWDKIDVFLIDKFHWWFIALNLYILIVGTYFNSFIPLQRIENVFGFVWLILISITTISFAFSLKGTSFKLLKGNDFSYGIYIFHVPIIYAIADLGFDKHISFIMVLLTVFLLAAISWFGIEKKALELKKKHF